MHPSLSVVRVASRLGHLGKMSKICSVSKLPVHILPIFSGVLNSYKKRQCPALSVTLMISSPKMPVLLIDAWLSQVGDRS